MHIEVAAGGKIEVRKPRNQAAPSGSRNLRDRSPIFEGRARLRAVEPGQVSAYPLGPRLPHMQPGADRAHRRHAPGRELDRECLGSLHLQRISAWAASAPADSGARYVHRRLLGRCCGGFGLIDSRVALLLRVAECNQVRGPAVRVAARRGAERGSYVPREPGEPDPL
jgi:hypothetical protein